MKTFKTIAVFAAYVLSAFCSFSYGQTSENSSLPPYRIQIGDSIELVYRFTPEYNQTTTVLPDGSVALQLLGNIHVAGLSVAEAHDSIVAAASTRLLNPELSLSLKEYDKPHFAVVGNVVTPGRFELHGKLTALDAIAMAGGLKPSAAEKRVFLVRRQGTDYAETTILDLHHLKRRNSHTTMPMIRDGDVIVAPTSAFASVERVLHVANVGAYYPFP